MFFSNQKILAKTALAVALAAGITSCDLMHDNTPPCATDPQVTTVVNFVYDYNMDGVDLFDSHVGSVYLYIFDKNGVFISRHEKNLADLDPANPDFSMTFDNTTSEIKMGETYQFVAMAQGKHDGYDDNEDTPGFKVLHEMIPGQSTIHDYVIRLNRDDKMFDDFGVVDYRDDYSETDAMIDSVWSTKPDEVQVHTIPYLKAAFDSYEQIPDHVEEVKIPMMRITNNIEVALVSPDFSTETSPKDYDILIYFPNGNGTIDFTGDLITELSQPLYYRALRKRVDTFDGSTPGRAGDGRGNYAIYATFGVSRLQYNDGAELQIRHPETHELIASIPNITNYFNEYGNTDYSDPQEYLDREFNFRINIGITSQQTLWWSQVGIGINDWAVIQWYVDL